MGVLHLRSCLHHAFGGPFRMTTLKEVKPCPPTSDEQFISIIATARRCISSSDDGFEEVKPVHAALDNHYHAIRAIPHSVESRFRQAAAQEKPAPE